MTRKALSLLKLQHTPFDSTVPMAPKSLPRNSCRKNC